MSEPDSKPIANRQSNQTEQKDETAERMIRLDQNVVLVAAHTRFIIGDARQYRNYQRTVLNLSEAEIEESERAYDERLSPFR